MRVLIPLIVVASLISACGNGQPPPQPLRPAVWEHPVPLAEAAGEVYSGAVRARVEADLAFRVPGRLTQRRVDVGDRVSGGQVLATLDPQDARLNLDAARAAVNAAEADYTLARAEADRHRELLGQGYVSQSLLDVRDNQAALALARLEQARAQLRLLQNQAGYTRLTAPEDGVVTASMAETGQVVAAGQPVFRFAADGGREVVVHVPEGRRQALTGNPVELRVTLWAHPDRVYQGRVREIAPQADPATRTHEIRVSIVDADEHVGLGMTAAVIAGSGGDKTLFQLPLSALAQHQGESAVWLITDDGSVGAEAVGVVRYTERHVVVGGRLQPQDRVVSAGVHLLVDGMSVRPVARGREIPVS